jgi:phosphate transport system protein
MPRQTLDREISQLQDEVLLLGSMVEQAMLNAVEALKLRDVKAARIINKAHDLRLLAAVLEVITEIERMGDYAKGIAKITVRLADDETPFPIREISNMADIAVSMLHRALGAFISEDVSLAYSIPHEDDQVDELYNFVTRKVIQNMIANPDTIDHTSLIMWVVHDIERFADRVTNICERTVFIATGELLEMSSSEDEFDEEDEAESNP